MSYKSEKLASRIQEIQQFVDVRIERYQTFPAVYQELARIADTLNQGKLIVQIVSHNPVSAQELKNFLNNHRTLTESYHFQSILLLQELEQAVSQSTADCDVLCLVIAPNQMHTIDQMQLTKKVSQTQISILAVVVEVSELTDQAVQQVNTIKANVRAWLQGLSTNLPGFEVYSASQRELEMFCDSLETLVRRKHEDILTKRLTAQVSSQLTSIEDFLKNRVRTLETENQQDEAMLQEKGGERLRRTLDRTIRDITDEKGRVFKEIKVKISESADDLLDEFCRDSLFCRLRNYINNLEIETKQEDNFVYITLVKKMKIVNRFTLDKNITLDEKIALIEFIMHFWQSTKNEYRYNGKSKYKIKIVKEVIEDANTAITNFCRSILSEWVTKEWEKVCNNYAGGGLIKFSQRTYERFELIPYPNLNCYFRQPKQDINNQQFFERLIEKSTCETSYLKVSLLSFVLSQIRKQLMQLFAILFILSIVGIASRREIIRLFIQPIHQALEYAPLPSILVLVVILYFLFNALVNAYQKYNAAEQKKAEDRLKDEAFRFYLGLSKNLVQKVSKKLLQAVELEEEWVDKKIQTVRQLPDQTNEEAENSQSQLKMRINIRNEQLNSLKRDLDYLKKLKRI